LHPFDATKKKIEIANAYKKRAIIFIWALSGFARAGYKKIWLKASVLRKDTPGVGHLMRNTRQHTAHAECCALSCVRYHSI